MRLPPTGRRLSPEEHERRLALWRQGMTDAEIATSLGMSAATVYSWRRAWGLGRVNKRKRKDDKYFKLLRCNDPLPPEELVVMKRRLRGLLGADW